MDEDSDDSFDAALAVMDMPTAPKVAKIQNAESDNTPSTSKKPVKPANNPHCVLVHTKQRGNPILKSILNVPIEFRDDIVPDYVVGRTSCVLYISLKYHNLNPDYICHRLKALGIMYELRVLLVQVDIPEPHGALKSLTRISLLADLTMILAWNVEEAGKIIETYKQFEKRPPDLIMGRVDSNPYHQLVAALTNIKPINKTDAMLLIQTFGTLENIINASEERLLQVVGLGPRKAKTLYKTLREPFLFG